MIPNFLGIGVPRAATTWAYDLLASHPDVYVPDVRKEVHYFDLNFAKGGDWYARFFKDAPPEAVAVGEFTPQYMFSPVALDRIASFGSIERFIILLRDPVARAYSHYGLRVRNNGYRRGFQRFLSDFPKVLKWGHYAAPLDACFARFGRDRVLVAITEEATAEPHRFAEALARHLGVPAAGFDTATKRRRVNGSFVPRHRWVYRLATRMYRWFLSHEWYGATQWAHRSGIKSALAVNAKPLPPMSNDDRRRLRAVFAGDIADVERLLGRTIAAWHDPTAHGPAPMETIHKH